MDINKTEISNWMLQNIVGLDPATLTQYQDQVLTFLVATWITTMLILIFK